MAGWRQVVELAMSNEEVARLAAVSRSRNGAWQESCGAAQMLLAHRENPSFFAAARALRPSPIAVQRCVEAPSGLSGGADDRPHRAKSQDNHAAGWRLLVSLGVRWRHEHGYPHELWTTRSLASLAREHGRRGRHRRLARLTRAPSARFLNRRETGRTAVRHDLEADAELMQRWRGSLRLSQGRSPGRAAAKSKKTGKPVAIVSTRKAGNQAIATTSPTVAQARRPPTFARDREYKPPWPRSQSVGGNDRHHRQGPFLSRIAIAAESSSNSQASRCRLSDQHRHQAHPRQSLAHFQETKAWLATCPAGRFEFTFTPGHGSWLNLVEGFFSKFARSVLRHIRVTSKQELKETHRRPASSTSTAVWSSTPGSYRLTQAA